ncbi:MAG: UDP-N-acetylmuramoyl-tripeptide--D-alanyl-D-alanine ligase [Bacteroidota bacterium]
MVWYIYAIHALAILFSFVIVRHFWFRLRFFIHVFQQVGYKSNEYWKWLKAHWEGRVVTGVLAAMNVVIFIIVFVIPEFEVRLTTTSVAFVLLSLGTIWFIPVGRYNPKKVKKPLVFTPRVKRLMIPFCLFSFTFPLLLTLAALHGHILPQWIKDPGLLVFDAEFLVFGWIFGAVLIPFFMFPAALLMKPVEWYVQEGYKRQARKKLASMPHLKVIALTGSYGKTSTKFMVRDLLKERFNVCTTPGSFNTPMGICKVINNDLNANHQILILEMGARYAGNIKELCDIARPDISIVTNVGFAHLETFGTQDVIAHEKGVIVDSLPPGGVAILNADDPRVTVMNDDRPELTVIRVGLEQGDIIGKDIEYNIRGTRFDAVFDDETITIQTQLLGAHNVHNLLLAVAAARHLGIRNRTIALGAETIEPIEHRLQLKQGERYTVIDDAFNSNPVGAKNAVEILGAFQSGQRILITPGMVELGDIEYVENKKFGQAIADAKLDYVFLVGEERSKPILEGIQINEEQHTGTVKVVHSLFEANDELQKIVQPGDVVLYENDLPDIYNE